MPRSTNRAFDILEALAGALKVSDKGLKHGEIAQTLRIPKSSLTKIIKDLLDREYLELDPIRKTYTLGPHVLMLAHAYLGNMEIEKVAQPIIYEAMTRTGESASLFVKKGNKAVVIIKENSRQILSAKLHIGETVPLYTTAGGKALLAFQPKGVIEAYLAAVPLAPLTSKTITDQGQLRRELENVRNNGMAYSYGEQFEDLVSIAAPVFDRFDKVVAAISMPFPYSRFNEEKKQMIEQTLCRSSIAVSKKLGAETTPLVYKQRCL